MFTRTHWFCTFTAGLLLALTTPTLTTSALAMDPEFIPHTPDTTGMPGQSVMFARLGPDGNLWVSSNNSGLIWLFGGIGIYNAASDTWTTHSSRHTPLQFWNYEIAWDSQGNAWIACENQLVKFDGDNWTAFGPGNSPLVGDRNWNVAIDANDHIWVANDDIDQVQGGLFEYDPAAGVWTHHDEPFMRTYFGISSPIGVYVRSNGEVWAVFQFMSGNAKRSTAGNWIHQGGPRILGFAETSDGTLYGVNGQGTYRYSDMTQSWSLFAPYTSSVIAIDAQDRIYVGTGDATYRFAGSTWSEFAQAPSPVKSIDFDDAGDVWIAYHHSVRQYDADGDGKRIYSSVMTGIGFFIVNNIEIDNEGNLWTMTGTTGASRFDGARYRNFSQYGHEEVNPFQVGGSLMTTTVNDVFQDSQGNVWFAANGVARSSAGSDLQEWELWYFANSNLPAGSMRAVGQDANGDIWAGSNGAGIYRFDGSVWHYRSLGSNFESNRVREIVTTTDGVMWVATYAGVHRFNGSIWTFFPSYSPQIPGMPIDLAAGLNGDVWIATAGGLVHHDGTNWFTYGPHNAPFMHSRISCVAVRGDGLVAACSEDIFNWPYSGDLCLFDGNEWRQFPGGYGNPNPFYQSLAMEFDRDGHLWIAQVNYGAVQVLVGSQQRPGDLNGDGVVDMDDVAMFVDVLLGNDTDPGRMSASDLNGDGSADGADIAWMIASVMDE